MKAFIFSLFAAATLAQDTFLAATSPVSMIIAQEESDKMAHVVVDDVMTAYQNGYLNKEDLLSLHEQLWSKIGSNMETLNLQETPVADPVVDSNADTIPTDGKSSSSGSSTDFDASGTGWAWYWWLLIAVCSIILIATIWIVSKAVFGTSDSENFQAMSNAAN
jgi:hypothetical protein